MSTGGGWQDQVGGLTGGIKYITSRPGMKQKLKVEYLDLDEDTKDRASGKVCTHLHRTTSSGKKSASGCSRKLYRRKKRIKKEALEEMKHLAVMMRYELEQGDVDAFARLLNEHWEVSKKLDTGSTNTCIDQIFCKL